MKNGGLTLSDKHRNFIAKDEVKFWIPILAMVVTITIWGMSLSGKLDVLASRFEGMDQRIARVEIKDIELTEKDTRFAQVLNSWATRFVALETIVGFD